METPLFISCILGISTHLRNQICRRRLRTLDFKSYSKHYFLSSSMARLSFAGFANSRLSSVNREFTKPRRQRQRERHQTKGLKALVNEDTLLPMMFLGLRKLENICCGHKMFLNKIRNLFCVPDTKFVSTTNVARAGKRGNICVGNNVSATMRPRLLGP